MKKIIAASILALATVITGCEVTQETGSSLVLTESATADYYSVVGKASTEHSNIKAGDITYGKLDNLGRATFAAGNLTQANRKAAIARGRQAIDIDPAGWPKKNTKVHISKIDIKGSKDYNGYMWNRSHLLADSLGGLPTSNNLVTGTRSQNVGSFQNSGGMAYTEVIARNYLDSAKAKTCSLYYAATPNYTGKELLPRTVTVDIKNCDGKIDSKVIVFNTANGYKIDYNNASFSK